MTMFEKTLSRDGQLVYKSVGTSMLPLIRSGKDLLVIVPSNGHLRKYDIPLYRRDDGRYVLHRVLKVRKEDYVICGDNRYSREYGISDRHVIGVLSSIIRDGKEYPLSGWRYRLYLLLWCDFFYVRAAILWFKAKIVRRCVRIIRHLLLGIRQLFVSTANRHRP